MRTGTISVQTENIFPIIKKYLYSDQEIFLRELVSNAVDATQKLKTLARKGDAVGQVEDLKIEVSLNKEAKTITISDQGIGMTAEEVEKYITEIAFSGAKEFLEKYDDAETVIGHFGLGFYSAFMVAEKVEIISKSWKEGLAAHWTCENSTSYTLEETDKKTERGTDIVLHISEEGQDYLNDSKISELLSKYCRFLPIEIKFGTTTETLPKPEDAPEDYEAETIEKDNIINDPTPIWTKTPSSLTDEDYKKFYRDLYPYGQEPLFWIHLNVDYPFNLTGILYFPKLEPNLEMRKDRIHLYSRQVFITDHVEEIVPEFLMLLHGVIDSPDIPLNVSRSYLQSDPEVKKINKYITKKVADKLSTMFKKERQQFEEKWSDIGVLIRYGMLSDEKFNDKAQKFALLENLEGKFFTISEAQEQVKAMQTDKNGEVVMLYTNDPEAQHGYIEIAQEKGYEVFKLDTILDPHFIGHLEQKLTAEKVKFKRVDSDTVDKLIDKDETVESVLTQEQQDTVKGLFEEVVEKGTAVVQLESMSPDDRPVMVTRSEWMRRMKDMSKLGGGGGMMGMGGLPESYNVVVNTNHTSVAKILEQGETDAQQKLAKQLHDLALLQQNMLKGKALSEFINRSIAMM
ncbi:MAG: molecular chaperone HtpG [Flavobacteriales bacterium]